VFLSSKSKDNLRQHLPKVSLKEYEGEIVVLKSKLESQDLYLYEPLIGQRVAFRLKGIIKTEENIAVS